MRPEILAPAGTWEALDAAVKAGANAVYVGGSQFSARAYAGNFDQDELLKAIDYCHLFDVKVYMFFTFSGSYEEILCNPPVTKR